MGNIVRHSVRGRATITDAIRVGLAILLAGYGAASQAANYVVLQLITTKLTIVTAAPVTGTSLDRNKYEAFPLSDDQFEEDLLQATTAALKHVDPNAAVGVVRIKPEQAGLLRERFEDDTTAKIEHVVALLKNRPDIAPDTMLVLVVPKRAELMLSTQLGDRGSGKAAGMGFYVDHFSRLRRSDTGESGKGFLAPFINIQVALIGIADGHTVSERIITAGTTLSAARSDDRDPWNVLTSDQKIASLKTLYRREIDRVVPDMLGQANLK